MKPFDKDGEYTPDEVKAALAGIDGTRQLSFRYERLDKYNNFIEDIDYVSSCKIENNALADIKRTAKFDVLDTGTINYLQDRIKPYIRLHMPESESYSDYVKTLKSDIWWKMDDPDQTLVYFANRTVANGITYNTFDTAYNMLEGDVVYANISGSNDATNRTVFWAKIDITANNPVDIYAYLSMRTIFNNVVTTWSKRTVYVQTGDTVDTLEEIPESYTPDWQPNWYDIEQVFPELKTYYFKFEAVRPDTVSSQVHIEWGRPRRINDTSGNEYHAMATGTYFGFPGLVKDGGTSVTCSNIIQTAKREFVTGPVFSGSVWLTASPSALKNIFMSSYETEDNTSGPEDSDCEAWIDYQLGKVCLFAGFNNYTYDVLMEKFFDVTFLRKVKHFAWSVNILEDRWVFWLDGVKHELDPATNTSGFNVNSKDAIPAVSRGNRVQIKPTTSSAPSTFDDFIWFNNAELGDEAAKKIYRLGNVGGQTRSGYVEWPQGVFVLSSPSRKMQDGNTVIREVEGYDQLVTLKEDSYDYRYSVKKGVLYTDAIRNIIQGTQPIEYIGLTDPIFVPKYRTNILSDTYATFNPFGAFNETNVTTALAVSFRGIEMSGKVVVDAAGQFSFQIWPGTDGMVPSNGLMYNYDGKLKAVINGNTFGTVTYNAATHAYWRVRESNGFFYCETSPNGSTWTILGSAPSGFNPEVSARINISGNNMNYSAPAVNGPSITSFSLKAGRRVKESIVSSATKLPTAMEWEPGTSKLSIVNDLLSAINYESATYNEDGLFVGKPYISPSIRPSEFRYATDSESVITGDIDQTVDLFAVPNKWVVIVSDPDRAMLRGEYTNSDPLSPTSTVSRGRTIVDFRTEQSAADQITLDALAARLAFEASQVYEIIEFDTAIMPIHQNADVYNLVVAGLGITNKYSETTWSMELKNGATMSHKVRKVVVV